MGCQSSPLSASASRAIALLDMMNSADALLEAWSETRHRRGGDPAVFTTSGEVSRTFDEIDAEAELLKRTDLAHFPSGTVIGIQIGNHPSWPALLLACLSRELVVLPLDAASGPQEHAVALAVCHAAGLVAERCGQIEITEMAAPPVDWNQQPPVLLKLTSGTTAAPRAIRFRSEQLLADCTQICDTMGLTGRDLNFGVVPVSHSYGFSNLLTPLLARGVALVLTQDRMPRAVLHDLAQTNATVFAGMPVFYQAFGGLEEVPPLPNLRLCISAGAPLPLPIAHSFRQNFGRPIHSFYGSSECGGICYDRDALLIEEGFVGQPMRDVHLELLDAGSAASRVRVQSAAAGDGYFPDSDDANLGGGFFMPDDLLAPDSGGFRIVGRVSDVINVAGRKVHPAEVEAALLAIEGVRAAVVFGRPSALRNEEVAACVVVESGLREVELLEFLRDRLSGWQVPRHIYFLDEMPVTARGKISRRALAERFQAR